MRHKKKPRFIQKIVQAHRIVGMVSAVFVLLLAVTGMLLNHTDALGLDRRYVQSRAMLWWYGLAAPDVSHGYPAGDAWVTQVEDSLYYNTRPLGRHYAPLLGAIDVHDGVALALADGILLLDRQGNTIEELRAPQGQAAVSAIGASNGRVVVQRGGQRLIADPALLTWTRVTHQRVRWATAAAPPAALRQAIRQDFQNHRLNAERVVRDLHNGRILGPGGVLLMDMMALAFIAMALSGAWMWWQRRNGQPAQAKKAGKSAH